MKRKVVTLACDACRKEIATADSVRGAMRIAKKAGAQGQQKKLYCVDCKD